VALHFVWRDDVVSVNLNADLPGFAAVLAAADAGAYSTRALPARTFGQSFLERTVKFPPTNSTHGDELTRGG